MSAHRPKCQSAGFPPELSSPIVKSAAKSESEIENEVEERMRLLLDHYKIDASNPHILGSLALRIVRDRIPGLRIVKPGRHRSITTNDLADLEKGVSEIKAQKVKCSTRHACRIFKERNRMHRVWGKIAASKTIENYYYRALRQTKRDHPS